MTPWRTPLRHTTSTATSTRTSVASTSSTSSTSPCAPTSRSTRPPTSNWCRRESGSRSSGISTPRSSSARSTSCSLRVCQSKRSSTDRSSTTASSPSHRCGRANSATSCASRISSTVSSTSTASSASSGSSSRRTAPTAQPIAGHRRSDVGRRCPIFDPERTSASWLMYLPARHRPRLHRRLSRFLFESDGLPFLPRVDEAEDTLVQLHAQAARPKLQATDLDLPMPLGRRAGPRDSSPGAARLPTGVRHRSGRAAEHGIGSSRGPRPRSSRAT